MNLPNAVVSCLRNYASFSGRATRSEYWYWGLAHTLLILPLSIVDQRLNPGTELGKMSWVVAVFVFALMLPSFAVTVRRLHDTDRSGWWVLLGCTGVGLPILIYWYCCKGTDGANRFGGGTTASSKPRRRAAAITTAMLPA